MHIIEVNDLTKDYGQGRGVFDVSLTVDEGEVFGFLGPNGAGKSTTIRHLMGFSKPQRGSTKIFGKETFRKYDEILSRVGYIPGEIALPAGLSGYGFLRMIQDLQGVHNQERLEEMRSLFALSDAQLSCETKRMSLGVKRKLAVTAAFMADPAVLILDEPTSGLDPVMQEHFIEFIKKEKERGKTILLSSHIFSEVDATCDRIAIIKDGRIVSTFVADELRHASRKYYTLFFESEAGKETFLSRAAAIPSFVLLKSEEGADISIEDRDLNTLIALLSECGVTRFGNRRESLQDYFMKFYKEDRDFGGALK